MTDVIFTRQAEAEFDEASGWYAARSVSAAEKWLDAIERIIDQLEVDPHRFPPAIECQAFPMPMQQATFGGGRKATHRLVFAIRPDKVVVYAVRHLAQRELSPDDLV